MKLTCGNITLFCTENHIYYYYSLNSFLFSFQEIFIDATLACGGKLYPAHKFVLSTCSDYFKKMFTNIPNKHPVVFLKDVLCKDLEALLDFMYNGEVNVPQSSLSSLIKTAEGLQIKGLAVPDDPPISKKDAYSKDKRDVKSRDSSYSPSAKRMRVHDKTSPNSSSRRSSHSHADDNLSDSVLPTNALNDKNDRISPQNLIRDSSNLDKPSELRNNGQAENDRTLDNGSKEPSPGPSGLRKSKEEILVRILLIIVN